MNIPKFHIYQTDHGEVRLSDSFVREAEAKWPDDAWERRFDWITGKARPVAVPRWVQEVGSKIDAMVVAGLVSGKPRLKQLKSIRALEIS
ncbi:MAG TPA: hypothetical protein VEY92_08435 [Pseudoxanthomonas sp.]|nr:hypothetical protein [Pseudoxanthomonas sp.]